MEEKQGKRKHEQVKSKEKNEVKEVEKEEDIGAKERRGSKRK